MLVQFLNRCWYNSWILVQFLNTDTILECWLHFLYSSIIWYSGNWIGTGPILVDCYYTGKTLVSWYNTGILVYSWQSDCFQHQKSAVWQFYRNNCWLFPVLESLRLERPKPFIKIGPIQASFCLFSFISHYKIEKA